MTQPFNPAITGSPSFLFNPLFTDCLEVVYDILFSSSMLKRHAESIIDVVFLIKSVCYSFDVALKGVGIYSDNTAPKPFL